MIVSKRRYADQKIDQCIAQVIVNQSSLNAPSGVTKADIRMNVSSLNATIYVDNLTFSTGAPPPDTTPPTVTSRTPANGATSVQFGQNVVAVFSEAVNGVGTSFTLVPQAGGAAIPATVTYDAAGTTATLNPTANLAASTAYTAQLTGVIADVANNGLMPVSWSFVTAAADTTVPTVTSKTPAAGATGVAVAVNITALFSEAVTGVSGTSFTLVPQAGGAAIPATVTLDAAGTTATLNPTASLAASTTYTVQLTAGITDLAGNALAPVPWSFTTGASGRQSTDLVIFAKAAAAFDRILLAMVRWIVH
jgi:hypothetical protein